MKIIYIVNARLPTEKAHGYQISKMCAEFARAGHQVELWAPTRHNPIKKDIFSYYGIEPNFKIRYIKSYDWLKWVKFLGRFSFYLQGLQFWLKLWLQKLPQDVIVYTRNPSIVWLFSRQGYKTVYECHDWFARSRPLALFFLRQGDFIITTNHYIKQEFIKYGFRKNILVAPNGIDLNIFQIKISKPEAIEKLKIGETLKNKLLASTVLLYTGSFRTMGVGKGIEEILEALRILKTKDLFFAALGGNSQDIEFYQKLALAKGVIKQATFLPRVSQDQLALWQRSADIMLMPFPDKAHYRYHMTPLKTFEYMASGRPIIASSLPSIKQILNENIAVFVKPGDACDLTRAIKRLSADKDLAQRIANKAQKEVEQYSWAKRAEKILEFIN